MWSSFISLMRQMVKVTLYLHYRVLMLVYRETATPLAVTGGSTTHAPCDLPSPGSVINFNHPIAPYKAFQFPEELILFSTAKTYFFLIPRLTESNRIPIGCLELTDLGLSFNIISTTRYKREIRKTISKLLIALCFIISTS